MAHQRIFAYEYRGIMGALVTLECGLDGTLREDRFVQLGHTLAVHSASRQPDTIPDFLEQPANNPLETPQDTSVQGRLTQIGDELGDHLTIRSIMSIQTTNTKDFLPQVVART